MAVVIAPLVCIFVGIVVARAGIEMCASGLSVLGYLFVGLASLCIFAGVRGVRS